MTKKALLNKVMILLLLVTVQVSAKAYYCVDESSQDVKEESLHVWTSTSLYPMVSLWADNYNLAQENITVEVNSFSGDQITAKVLTGKSLGFLTAHQLASLNHSSTWKLPVGRDVLVPITNAENPLLEKMMESGVSRDLLKTMIARETGTIYATNKNNELSQIAMFLDAETNAMKGLSILSKEELLLAIQKDKHCIGFCHLADILNMEQTGFIAGVALIPIDANNNGTIDNFENIYSNLQSFARGVWIGKYPKALTYNIYSIAADRPTNVSEQAFLEWIISDGQEGVAANGYIALLESERKTKIASIYGSPTYTIEKPVAPGGNYGVVIVISLLLLVFIFLVVLIKGMKKDSALKKEISGPKSSVLDGESIQVPSGIFFSKSHSWAFMEKDGFVRIGIDDFLSKVTGPLTNIKLKEPGQRIKEGEVVYSIIQKGKQLDIKSPVTGTIVKTNSLLFEDTALINRNPYTDGWVYTIEPLSWLSEIGSFMMGLEYTEWLDREFVRLKDFLANCCKNKEHKLPIMVLQDGGEIKNYPLSEAGPLTWEEFQNQFID